MKMQDEHGQICFLISLNYFCSRICGPLKKYETPPPPHPLENPEPWDHAQMVERKILFRRALTRALYDQLRPKFLFFFLPSDVCSGNRTFLLSLPTEPAVKARGPKLLH